MQEQNPDGGSAQTVRGTVKWFNPDKGYGFVQPGDGSADVFLHISTVKQAGFNDAPKASTIVCEVVQAAKGRQVSRIVELDTSTAEATPPRRPRPEGGHGFRAGGPRPPRRPPEGY
ncbi:MAG: cold shock domain-containing protein [Proteobacteria bacterium]|nr:cold shock domain-containing protein [Pseudomonadota bacterium]